MVVVDAFVVVLCRSVVDGGTAEKKTIMYYRYESFCKDVCFAAVCHVSLFFFQCSTVSSIAF